MIISSYRFFYYIQGLIVILGYIGILVLTVRLVPEAYTFEGGIPWILFLWLPLLGIPFYLLDFKVISITSEEIVIKNFLLPKRIRRTLKEVKSVSTYLARTNVDSGYDSANSYEYEVVCVKFLDDTKLTFSADEFDNYLTMKRTLYKYLKKDLTLGAEATPTGRRL